MTDPREPPAAGTPPTSPDIVVEGVDDPRFPLLDAEWPEYGLRIDPATGGTPARPSTERPGPAIVRAPTRPSDAAARRRAARVVTAGAILPILVVAAIGAALLYRSTTGGDDAAHRVRRASVPPPAFTVSTTVTAHAKAEAGITVAPAGNGGLWYQAADGPLTRLASVDGRVNYSFSTGSQALGLAVSGQTLLAVTDTPTSMVIAHDRGSGAVTGRVPLPGTPVCGFAAPAGCDPAVADGAAWVALDEGVARVEGSRATLIPVPGVRDVASGGRRIWAISGEQLYRLDPSTGRVLGRSSLRGLAPVAMTAGAGAVWVAGTRDGRQVVLRFDGPASRAPLVVAMPSPVRALAATEHAVWVALQGGGVRELDPSRNRLVGTTVGLPDQDALLVTRPGQLWGVRLHDGRADFTRIDLTPAP